MKTAPTLTALFLVLTSVTLAHSQHNGLLNALETVEAKQRPLLAKRLRLFIKYQRTQQWKELSKLTVKYYTENKSPEEFTKEMSSFGHLGFIPERAMAQEPNGSEYRIFGCVKVRTERGTWLKGGLIAYLVDGEWYFTPYFLSYDGARQLPCGNIPRSSDEGG